MGDNGQISAGQPAVEEGGTLTWRGVGASVRGTSHEISGQVCQDTHYWRVGPGNTLVAAVTDGAGSAKLAELGAEIAAKTAVLALFSKGEMSGSDKRVRSRLTGAFKEARKAVKAVAAACRVDVRELATTLVLVVATPELVGAAQVGDGAAVLGDRQGNVIGLTTPQGGEYVNETTFLNSRRAMKRLQVTVWRGSAAHMAIFSDGLQRLSLKMPGGTPHGPFFAPLFSMVSDNPDNEEPNAQLESFLRSPRVTESTSDDLTLLLFALVA